MSSSGATYESEERIKLTSCVDISYWQHETGAMGFFKEVGGAALTGGVAKTGTLREIKEDEIKKARANDSSMSS